MDSLRSQTLQDFETLVVNDGAPLAADVAADERVRVVVPEAPGGRTRALNTGLRAARGSFVAYLDDDDLFEPVHLERLVAAASKEGVVGAYSDAILVVQTTDGEGHYREERRQPIFGREFDADRLLFSNYIPLICLLHRREAALDAGHFDETFDLFEDWDFLVRLTARGPLAHVVEPTALYRIRDDGTNATTASPWHSEKAEAARLQLFRKHWSRHRPEAEMALIDAYEKDFRELEEKTHASRAAAEKAGLLAEEARASWSAAEAAREALARELEASRAERDAARSEAVRREAGLLAEIGRRDGTIDAMNRSLAWRVFAPYWKLKKLLGRP